MCVYVSLSGVRGGVVCDSDGRCGLRGSVTASGSGYTNVLGGVVICACVCLYPMCVRL